MLINLRNALMAGKRLPYDAEVEYLESTGTQWIDTGIVPTTDTSCNLVFSVTALDSTYRTPLSVRSRDGAADSFTMSSGTTSDSNFAFGTGHWEIASPIPIPSVGEVYLATLKSGLATIGDATGNAGLSITPSGLTAYLFARNSNGTASNFLKGRIYSCQIYQNGVLVRDFIPVRKGTVGYMYDRVSGNLFGNAGTGDFVLGPDVVPVEYIESHGTEYIDTGVYLTSNHSVEMDFQLTSTRQSRKGLFGGFSTSRYGALLSPANSSLEFGYGTGNVYYQITPDALRHSAKQQKNLLYLDGVLIHTFDEAAFTSSFSAPLGNFSYTNYAPAQAKYYLSKWYNGDTLIRSFRPVRVGTEGAMMDVLTRRIYRNAGTGAFTYGNDLKYPIPAA